MFLSAKFARRRSWLLVKWSAQRGVASVASKADEVAGLWDFMLAMDDKAVIDGLM